MHREQETPGPNADPIARPIDAAFADALLADRRIRIIIGHYGSGKTEFAVNYALALAALGRKTAICDLDIVNPYFRSRERKTLLEASSIRVISNSIGAALGVDVPAVSAEVEGPIRDDSWDVVIDAGGDAAGARVLGRYSSRFTEGGYDMFCVLNANRPGTRTVDDAVAHVRAIEESSRTRVTALVNNTHLLYETGPEHVLAGQRLAEEVSDRLGLPIAWVSALAPVAEAVRDRIEGGTASGRIFPLTMHMRDEWMQY